jgi:hypothetical protein
MSEFPRPTGKIRRVELRKREEEWAPATSRPEPASRSDGLRLVGADLPITEVADQQVAAEGAEPGRRCHRNAPRRVQLTVLGDPADQIAGRIVCIDEAEALVRDLVLGVRVLVRVLTTIVPLTFWFRTARSRPAGADP